jgi:hypothetical protein
LLVVFRATLVYHDDMLNQPSQNAIPFDRPATYQITVQGKLDPTSVDLLGGMNVHHTVVGAGHIITTLEGEIQDQAALAGVLNTLYELHLPVLMVMRLNI